jgi:hypothetical protein
MTYQRIMENYRSLLADHTHISAFEHMIPCSSLRTKFAWEKRRFLEDFASGGTVPRFVAAFIERNVERSCFCHCIWAASPSARERFRRSESATVSTWRAFCFSDAPAPDFVMPRLSDTVVVPRAQYMIGGIIPHYLHMFCSPMLPGTWNLHNLTTLANTCKLAGCPRQHVQAVCTVCQIHPHNISLRADRRQLPRYIWPSPRVLSTLSGLSLAHDKSQSLQANTPISTMNRRSD